MSYVNDGELPPSTQQTFSVFSQKLLPLYVQSYLSAYEGLSQQMEAQLFKHTLDHLVMQLRANVVGDSTETDYRIVRYPRTWWDGFKAAYFSDRMLKNWPAEYTEERITTQTVMQCCPHLGYPEKRKHIEWLMHRNTL